MHLSGPCPPLGIARDHPQPLSLVAKTFVESTCERRMASEPSR